MKTKILDAPWQAAENPGVVDGDQLFLQKFQDIGRGEAKISPGQQILFAVRHKYGGRLKYHPASDKFVESPDRFWSIQVHPHTCTIIVFGKPGDHGPKGTIALAPYMASYSCFVIRGQHQTHEAVQTILDAQRYKRLRDGFGCRCTMD